VSLRGTVDRLDTWKDGENTYVRVVDYKTGAKSFSETDISVGLNVQLLLYLFSVLHAPDSLGEGNLLPAGALYFSARPGETASDTLISADDAFDLVCKNIARDGILLDDERVLTAMEADLGGKFIPVTKKADALSGKSLRSAEEIEKLEASMCETIRTLGESMVSGDASTIDTENSIVSAHDPCKYCKMNPICRASLTKGEN
jgi:ATP-dependent helicase/nuclease subunit B